MINKSENNKPLRPSRGQAWWQPALVIGGQITGWILGPLLIALFLGQWLDEKYNSSPKFLLIFVGIAFIISNVGIILNTIKYSKDLEKLKKLKNEDKSRTSNRK